MTATSKGKRRIITAQNRHPSVFYLFWIGMLPVILLIIITNVLDQEVLDTLVTKILSIVPNDEIESVLNEAHKQTKQEKRSSKLKSTNYSSKDKILKQTKRQDNNENTLFSPRGQYNNNNNNINDEKRQENNRTYNIDQNINVLREEYRNDSKNIYKALALADALRARDLLIHDGGSIQNEAIDTYRNAIHLIAQEREIIISTGGDARMTKDGHVLNSLEELFLSNEDKSIHALLTSSYCSLGKQYFMANMFELAIEAYNKSLDLDADYIDALNARASTQIILGKFDEAGNDYERVLALDRGKLIPEVFTGLVKVLLVKEDAVKAGWDEMVSILNDSIASQEDVISNLDGDSHDVLRVKKMAFEKLVRHCVFK